MYKWVWKLAGLLSLGMAYIGVITPGIPYSTFVVLAAYCFAKSSPAMHSWIYNHKLFGPFLINWTEKKVFPRKMKYFMLLTMSSSLIMLWFTTHNLRAIFGTGIFMLLVAIWAWRYPSTISEFEQRKLSNKKIGWFN